MISTSIFSFHTSLAIGLFALLSITILYLLKVRKRKIQVPFSPIWANILLSSSPIHQWKNRLRRILSWLLNLLIATLLLLALLDLHRNNEAADSRHILILLDNSASMAATDVTGAVNRFEAAKSSIRNILPSFDSTDRIMLATFNSVVQPRTPFLSDPSLIDAALHNLSISASGTQFQDALSFAVDTLSPLERAELIILSDGASPTFVSDFSRDSLPLANHQPPIPIRWVPLGESHDSISITAFSPRPYPSNRLDYELLVQVESSFDRPIDAELELFSNSKLIQSTSINIPPNGVHREITPNQPASGERLEARVRITTPDARDIFPFDNRAYATLPKILPIPLTLVTNGNLFLEGTLLLNHNISLTTLSPTQYQNLSPAAQERASILIMDGVALPAPPHANVLWINPPPSDSPLIPWHPQGKPISDPIIDRLKKGHPILRWISFQDLNIKLAQPLSSSPNDLVIAASISGTPIIIAREEHQRKQVAIAFDIRNSDLPLRVAFPVLMINIIDWFSIHDLSQNSLHLTDSPISLNVPNNLTSLLWRPLHNTNDPKPHSSPSPTPSTIPVLQHRALLYTSQPGFYSLTANPPESNPFSKTIAVNFVNRFESNVTPHSPDPSLPNLLSANELSHSKRQHPWIWLAIAAFALLFLEWFSYNRRLTE